MEITNKTKITAESIEKKLETAKAEDKVIKNKAHNIRDGADLREALALGVDNRVIDELNTTDRGKGVMYEYLELKSHLSRNAYEQSDGIYNEVLPNGDRRRKLSEVNPITGEVINCMQTYTKTFTIPKLPWKK